MPRCTISVAGTAGASTRLNLALTAKGEDGRGSTRTDVREPRDHPFLGTRIPWASNGVSGAVANRRQRSAVNQRYSAKTPSATGPCPRIVHPVALGQPSHLSDHLRMASSYRTSSSLIRNSFSSSLLSTKIAVPPCDTSTMQRQHTSSPQRTGATDRDQTTRALAAWSRKTGPLLSRDQHSVAFLSQCGIHPEIEWHAGHGTARSPFPTGQPPDCYPNTRNTQRKQPAIGTRARGGIPGNPRQIPRNELTLRPLQRPSPRSGIRPVP